MNFLLFVGKMLNSISINPLSAGTVFMPESDVCKRYILTYKDVNESIKTFLMAVDPSQLYTEGGGVEEWS